MRVVHSCTSNSFSGLESYVLDLVTWQRRHGRTVELYCRAGSALEEHARGRGIPLWTIGAGDRPGPLLWARMMREWRRRFRESEVVLHLHAGGEPWFHLPWLLAKPGRLAKAVLHYHIWINHRKTDPVHRALFLGIDEVWASSETARAHLAARLPIARDRIRVVPYGRDVQALRDAPRGEWRREVRSKFGLSDDEVLGVCVSRIEPIKGVRELFDAFLAVAARRPKAHLMIVGDASPANDEAAHYAAEIRARHERLDPALRRRLHLPGFVSPCWPVLAAADFYVLPSYEECMSLAMLDAVILGLPVIGTRSGGTPSVARPEETGLLVPPADAESLAKALDELYGNPETCRRLGEGARALGASFDREDIFARIWDWYEARPPTTIGA